MKSRISSAFKHFALSVTLRGLSQRKRTGEIAAPEPRRQPLSAIDCSKDDWMFDQRSANAVEHRIDMLSNEMDRLSDSLSGLRNLLSGVAVDAPMFAALEAYPNTSPMIADRDLFEGEPLAATPNAIPAAGGAEYLFDEEIIAEGHNATTDERAIAA